MYETEHDIFDSMCPGRCLMISKREEQSWVRKSKIERKLASRADKGPDDIAVQSLSYELRQIDLISA